MKFALAAVVVLAVAMGVQSSLIAGVPGLGLGINGLGIHGLGIHGVGIHGLGINGIGINGLGLAGHGLGLAGHGIGLAGHGIGGIVGPLGHHGAILAHNPGLYGVPAAVNIASGPIGGVAVAHQAAIAGPLVGHGHGATYVAKTRGAIHTAPLAGHINSAASINVAPAPGTW